MSSVVVIAPLVIANWPVITAAVTAAIGTMGFTLVGSAAASVRRDATSASMGHDVQRTEIEVEESEILAGTAGQDQKLIVERDGIRAIFSRDARGALKLCMEGRGVSKSELKQIGEDLVGRVTQQYAYHRIMSELKERNMTIVDEEVTADRSVRIRVKNF